MRSCGKPFQRVYCGTPPSPPGRSVSSRRERCTISLLTTLQACRQVQYHLIPTATNFSEWTTDVTRCFGPQSKLASGQFRWVRHSPLSSKFSIRSFFMGNYLQGLPLHNDPRGACTERLALGNLARLYVTLPLTYHSVF